MCPAQCPDVLRAMQKWPAVVGAFFADLQRARGGHGALDPWVAALRAEFKDLSGLKYQARGSSTAWRSRSRPPCAWADVARTAKGQLGLAEC